MKSIKKCLLLLLCLFSSLFIFGNENISLISLEESQVDISNFEDLFLDSVSKENFSDYENQLIFELQAENPSKEVVAEGIFYSYFYNNLDLDTVISEDKLITENQVVIKDLVNSHIENYYSVLRFFQGKARSSLFKKYDIGQGVSSLNVAPQNSDDILYLSNEKAEKMSLLSAISEVEALNQRFSKMTNNEDGTSLRFSDEAYIKTSQNPSLVYVMENEPDYEMLYNAYKEAGKNIQNFSFGETQDAYYNLVEMLKTLDMVAKQNGLILSDILSPFSLSIVRLYHTSPYVLTMLSFPQLQYVINEIDFMCNYSSYNSRLVSLLKK